MYAGCERDDMTQMNQKAGQSNAGQQGVEKSQGLSNFLTARVLAGILICIVVLWGSWVVLSHFGGGEKSPVPGTEVGMVPDDQLMEHVGAPGVANEPGASGHGLSSDHEKGVPSDLRSETGVVPGPEAETRHGVSSERDVSGQKHGAPIGEPARDRSGRPMGSNLPSEHVASPEQALFEGPSTTPERPKAVGVHLVEATISALDQELNGRFWGWRRNDLIRFTDNVENIQLGVLEVVRRTSVNLMEKMSRHGPQASIDKNLEDAMNWLMIKPEKYWLPSAEEKYNASLKELRQYADKLERGEAHFYVRADTFIPLLMAFADLAGSCDENLVKTHEDDGSPVSWFEVDDYFYYARGVAEAMGKILHAAREDFSSVLEARQGVELLNRAIHACHLAADLDPWIVTDAALDGILANHRANMAAEMSHVRYFLNALAKALAT